MTQRLKIAFIALALGCTALTGAAHAKEVTIGTINYEARPTRDVIEIGGREGQFRSVRFEVRQSDVEILDLRIVYGNGQTEDIGVRQNFKAGSSSRVIDLQGAKRSIRQVIVTYSAKGPARIVFFGVEAGASWERLGCKDVRFSIDRDIVKVGRKEGSFRAIRLKVRSAPVEFYDLRVYFGSGARQDIRVRSVIPQGGESRAIDLVGENRGIDRIEMIYRSIPNFKGTAEVCVDGLQR